MKRFITRGICFIGIGLMLLFVLNFFYVRTNGYRSSNDTYKFYLMPEKIEVANLGSSHGAYGFYYDDIDEITGFNFALPGQSLHYDLKILEKYGDRLSEGCVVIIPISYFSFDQHKGTDNQSRWYYSILDYGSINNHKLTEYVKHGLLPILSASFKTKFLINDKEEIDFDIFWIYKYLGIDYSKDDIEGYKQNAQGHLEYYHNITGEGEYEEFNMAALEGIIKYCQENGFEPVLITMPFTKYYNELFAEEFYADFYAKIEGVRERYGINYIDYSRDPRITENLELFNDSNHLSETGREVFTKILLSDLGLI